MASEALAPKTLHTLATLVGRKAGSIWIISVWKLDGIKARPWQSVIPEVLKRPWLQMWKKSSRLHNKISVGTPGLQNILSASWCTLLVWRQIKMKSLRDDTLWCAPAEGQVWGSSPWIACKARQPGGDCNTQNLDQRFRNVLTWNLDIATCWTLMTHDFEERTLLKMILQGHLFHPFHYRAQMRDSWATCCITVFFGLFIQPLCRPSWQEWKAWRWVKQRMNDKVHGDKSMTKHTQLPQIEIMLTAWCTCHVQCLFSSRRSSKASVRYRMVSRNQPLTLHVCWGSVGYPLADLVRFHVQNDPHILNRKVFFRSIFTVLIVHN